MLCAVGGGGSVEVRRAIKTRVRLESGSNKMKIKDGWIRSEPTSNYLSTVGGFLVCSV